MKLPFSYKQHVFSSILFASFLGHMVLIGAGSSLSPSPQYAVEQAPSSMEVVLLTERKVKEKQPEPEKIIAIKDPSAQAFKLLKEKEKEIKKQEQKPVYVPPIQGAVTEVKPAYLKNPAPVYPEYARTQGWEGSVLLKVFVNTDGTVGQIVVDRSSGHKILDGAALKTVKTWQFLPARMGKLSFSSWIKIPIRFRLVEE